MRVNAVFPRWGSLGSVGYACRRVCKYMRSDSVDTCLWFPSSPASLRETYTRDTIPAWMWRVTGRLESTSRPIFKLLEVRFLRSLEDGDCAYLWPMIWEPSISVSLCRRVKDRGFPVVVEMVNTHRATAKRIIDDAAERLGWADADTIEDAVVERERARAALADYFFAPSPGVRQSLLDEGIPAGKILSTSYGWDLDRFNGQVDTESTSGELTFAFVGYVSLRKGIPLLLDAWAHAGIKGRLTLTGRVQKSITTHCAEHLNRDDVSYRPHSEDMATLYRPADVFVFPTLEEGSPLVTYEALASGLPIITSPMGAGDIVRDGIEGIHVDPFDRETIIDAMRRLASDPDLRRQMGQAGMERAREYTWDKVGARRSAQLLDVLQS